jgi:hypothetical protein
MAKAKLRIVGIESSFETLSGEAPGNFMIFVGPKPLVRGIAKMAIPIAPVPFRWHRSQLAETDACDHASAATVARHERSEIRGGIDASWQSWITLRSIRATLAVHRHGRTCSGHPRLWFDALCKDVDARDARA